MSKDASSHPAFELLQSLRPYDGAEVVEKIMWPFVDHIADLPWQGQQFEAELKTKTVGISVRRVVYHVSVDAMQDECEVDVSTGTSDDDITRLDIDGSHDETEFFSSGLITIHETVGEIEKNRGIQVFKKRYPELVPQLGTHALAISKVTAFSFDGDNDLEVFDYQASTHPDIPDEYWVIGGIDPRMADADEKSRLESSTDILLEPSAHSLSVANMRVLRIALRAHRAPKDVMDQMSLLQMLGK